MEYSQGTNPRFSDSDLCEDGTSCPDGMYDGWEYYWGLDPLSPDSEEDLDNDTLSNIYEYDNMLVESKIFSLSEPSLRAYWKFDGDQPLWSPVVIFLFLPVGQRILGDSWSLSK